MRRKRGRLFLLVEKGVWTRRRGPLSEPDADGCVRVVAGAASVVLLLIYDELSVVKASAFAERKGMTLHTTGRCWCMRRMFGWGPIRGRSGRTRSTTFRGGVTA